MLKLTHCSFGCLITLGAVFIWFYVPETSRLTLEEMDTVFGSSGVAQADQERMAAINIEIGLEAKIQGLTGRSSSMAGFSAPMEKRTSSPIVGDEKTS